ncbi:MAG: GAF domain-containing protein [Solirubrobacterales bacterium]|nr:GAF domain-containing protein [Solirubrobacterales bacterium]
MAELLEQAPAADGAAFQGGGDGATDYREVLEAFRQVAGAISDETDPDDLLHLIAAKICSLLSIRRCSVYLKDPETDLFHGQVAETGRKVDAAIKRLTAGVESDGFTREILARKEPVLIRNAKSDPRPVRSTMREWDVKSMLGVPMVHNHDVIGLLFLDNADEHHDYTDSEQEMAATFANLAAIAVAQSQRTARLASSFKTVARQNKLLRRSSAIEDRLTNLVLDGAGLGEIASTVASLTSKPCAIYDNKYNRLAMETPEGEGTPAQVFDEDRRRRPEVAKAISGLEAKQPSVIGPLTSAGLPHRFMVIPITLHDDNWGYVVITAQTSQFNQMDTIVARRASTIIALELTAEQRAADAEVHSRGALARDLIFGTDSGASLTKRAHFHGMDFDRPHVVALITRGSTGRRRPPSARRLALALRDMDPSLQSCVSSVKDGVAAVVEVPGDAATRQMVASAKDRLTRAADESGSGGVTISISTVCRGVESFGGAYEQARQVFKCATELSSGDSPVLAADDLGAGRLLLAAPDGEETRRFADDTLGPLVDASDPAMVTLLATMSAFYEHARSIRQSAASLDVHENTIRYRLGRIEEITGLDLASNSDDQLSGQMALLVLRLQGRMPSAEEVPDEAAEPVTLEA